MTEPTYNHTQRFTWIILMNWYHSLSLETVTVIMQTLKYGIFVWNNETCWLGMLLCARQISLSSKWSLKHVEPACVALWFEWNKTVLLGLNIHWALCHQFWMLNWFMFVASTEAGTLILVNGVCFLLVNKLYKRIFSSLGWLLLNYPAAYVQNCFSSEISLFRWWCAGLA